MLNISLEPTYVFGFYEVGSKNFINKPEALMHATTTGQSVRWNFHDKIFNTLNWTKQPNVALSELYRRRAQQIRDEYDYVVVNFSGGADSWTTLHSFLSNGLHVDEVFTRWAFVEQKYKKINFTDRRESNIISEYEYAVLPVLEHIRKNYPKTQIYIDDYSDGYESDIEEKKFTQLFGHYLCVGTVHRFFRKSPFEIDAAKKNKRVAIVHGLEKIQCCVKDGEFFAYFHDSLPGTDLDPDRNLVPFYYTPDLPELPLAQAHELKQFYERNLDRVNESPKDYLRDTYIKVCYPDYNYQTFQTGKALGSEIWESEFWIRHHNPRYFDNWKWAINQYASGVDERFCQLYNDKFRVGWKLLHSQYYSLGPLTKLDK